MAARVARTLFDDLLGEAFAPRPDEEPVTAMAPTRLVRRVVGVQTHGGFDDARPKYARLWFEKATWFLWHALGRRALASRTDAPRDAPEDALDGWVRVDSTLLRRVLGSYYLERFVKPFVDAEVILVSHRYLRKSGQVPGWTKSMRLDPALLEGPWHEVRFDRLDAKIRELEQEQLARLREEAIREGEGRIVALSTAYRCHETSRAFAAIRRRRELATHSQTRWIVNVRPEDFTAHVHLGERSGRWHTPVVNLPRPAKARLRLPDGQEAIQWDWVNHHLWLLAMLAEDARFVESMSGRDFYDELRRQRERDRRTTKFEHDRYFQRWLAAAKLDDSSQARRDYMKERVLSWMNGARRTKQKTWVQRYMEDRYPIVATQVDDAKRYHGGKGASHLMYREEREVRRFVLNGLYEAGLRQFLDEHDGGTIAVKDTRILLDVLREANLRFFNGRADAKFILEGEKRKGLVRDLSRSAWTYRDAEGRETIAIPFISLTVMMKR